MIVKNFELPYLAEEKIEPKGSKFKSFLIGSALLSGVSLAIISYLALSYLTLAYFAIGVSFSAKFSLLLVPIPLMLLSYVYITHLPGIVSSTFKSMTWHWKN